MLQAYKQHLSARYSAGEQKTIDIDPIVSFTPVINAKIVFYNTEDSVTFNIKVINWLSLGENDDPLNNGDYDFQIYGNNLGAGDRIEVLLNGSIDGNLSLYQLIIRNSSPVEAVLHIIVEGLVDSATQVTVPV